MYLQSGQSKNGYQTCKEIFHGEAVRNAAELLVVQLGLQLLVTFHISLTGDPWIGNAAIQAARSDCSWENPTQLKPNCREPQGESCSAHVNVALPPRYCIDPQHYERSSWGDHRRCGVHRWVILLAVHGAVTGAHRMFSAAHRDRPFQVFSFSCGSVVRVCRFFTFCILLQAIVSGFVDLCRFLHPILWFLENIGHVHKCSSSWGPHGDGEREIYIYINIYTYIYSMYIYISPYHQIIGFPIASAR